MGYTRNRRRRKPPRIMGSGRQRGFFSRFFFPDGMVDPDSTNDRQAIRSSWHRIGLVLWIPQQIYRIWNYIRHS